VFSVMHFARYGAEAGSLIYVSLLGLGLSWISVRTQRVSPCVISHCINNLVAVLGQGLVVQFVAPFLLRGG
jgi:membrane protease YdiL (CAAX protease family)